MAETRFHTLLRIKIEEAIRNRSESIVSGHCDDYASYRGNVEYVNGLKDALELCQEVEKEFD